MNDVSIKITNVEGHKFNEVTIMKVDIVSLIRTKDIDIYDLSSIFSCQQRFSQY